MFDWQTALYVAGGTVVTVSTLWTKFKKAEPKLASTIEAEAVHVIPHGIATFGEEAIKVVENIAESPFFAGKVAAGELKAKHVIDELTQTKAVSEAKTVLLGIGKVYASLSDAEKLKAEVTLKLALSEIGISMTDAQIQTVFSDAQKAIESLQATAMFKASFEQPAQPQA